MWSLKPFNGAEMRSYLDILNEADDGTKVTIDPATGNKTVSGAEGTTTYDPKGQKISYQSPTIQGYNQSTNYQTGEKTTTGQVGDINTSMTQRPDQSTVTTASVPLGHNVQATASKGIGFGGAGKDIKQGGNQITSITARTAKNPEGVTSSFTGQPSQQDLEKAIPDDWAASGNEFTDPDSVNEETQVPATSPQAGEALQNFKNGVDAGMEMYNLLRQGGVPLTAAIPAAYKYGQSIATGDASHVLAYSANTIADSMSSIIGDFAKLYANLTPGSAYYQKNIAPNPQLVATAAEILKDAPTVEELKNSVAVLKSTAQQLKQPQDVSKVGVSGSEDDIQAMQNQFGYSDSQGNPAFVNGQSNMQTTNEDEELPGTKGEWRHGGHSVKYDPKSLTVHVKGKGGEHKHTFGKHPKNDAYRSRVQQIIDKLENNLTEAEKLRDLMNRLT